MVKVRFAPSPTGPFSLGNARTALFNWLFARHEGGQFLLRIEDTDKERSQKKFEKEIINSLIWLGLNWHGSIVYQSQRLEIYKRYLGKLLKEGWAYYCNCSLEMLEAERQAQLSQGLAPKYSGRCRNLNNTSGVIRFKMPAKIISFHDLIRGNIKFDTSLLGDIVIAKSLEEPLYNFAVVVDDWEMGITQVIRGEDHISNTPKQLILQEVLNIKPPKYAHLSLILTPDRKKLSSRFLQKSFGDYKKDGYLAEAMLNFLVLLGWHPVQDREILSLEEMIAEFDLGRVQKAGAVFNQTKLDWLNAYYLRHLEINKLLERLKPFVSSRWLKKKNLLKKVIEIEKERLKSLKDFAQLSQFFFKIKDYPASLLIWENTPSQKIRSNLETVANFIKSKARGELLKPEFEKEIFLLAQKEGRGEILWPLRVALSGKKSSPGPLEIIKTLGKTESLKRINLALKKLKNS